MKDHFDPCPVSDTAALVMLWASRYYVEIPIVKHYIERLDLTHGYPLLKRYNEICPWYSEVIINRKHFIKNAVTELLKNDPERTVIVNLGAGFSPLGLELLPWLSDNVRFTEIDLRNMEIKQRLYAELAPDHLLPLSCIKADITDTQSLRDILREKFNETGSTRLIVVMEGLSYYIDQMVMQNVMDSLKESFPNLAIVFEHLKPCPRIHQERRYIPYDIFSHVRDYTGIDRMTTYAEDEIVAMLGPGFSTRYSDMDEMELRRTQKSTYFPAPEYGWLSVAVGERK
ncbi:MAG: class I SAM-dependent methyltransferase [Methanocalculus sp.]|uniref:class I SAM-dependent methyltransferase n=1 Tax=Methanocalculus sp. TaxID=2004547 RepID=UPI002727695D|nr:class I SAM-dependent methyltransferase [Methanocalculus sp.]MDO9540690.1 class I SAM-dependent methyltransferase [Methanocalculus sp.]